MGGKLSRTDDAHRPSNSAGPHRELFGSSGSALHQVPRKINNMSEKKRKRRDEGGERPKKKAATVARGDVQVELLENKGVLGPLLGMCRKTRS